MLRCLVNRSVVFFMWLDYYILSGFFKVLSDHVKNDDSIHQISQCGSGCKPWNKLTTMLRCLVNRSVVFFMWLDYYMFIGFSKVLSDHVKNDGSIHQISQCGSGCKPWNKLTTMLRCLVNRSVVFFMWLDYYMLLDFFKVLPDHVKNDGSIHQISQCSNGCKPWNKLTTMLRCLVNRSVVFFMWLDYYILSGFFKVLSDHVKKWWFHSPDISMWQWLQTME